jgi:hypothetical protein
MSWTKVYANDAAGGIAFGDVNVLIRAVYDGASVKVVLASEDLYLPLTAPYLYSLQAHTVHVRNGLVFATSTLDVSTTFAGDDLRFQDDSFYYMVIASTSGALEQIRWNVGEHVPRGHDQGTWAMRWFVN